MKKNKNHQIINNRGEVVELDDDAIIPDGYGVRVSGFLMDGVPTVDENAMRMANVPRGTNSFLLHRPGFVRDSNDDAARDAHAAMVKRTTNAWRGADAATPEEPDTPESAREAYKKRVSNAWRTGQVISGTSPPAPRHWARPAREAWPQGGWTNQNPSPKPPDRTLDAAPDSNAAWNEMVRRNENAWRAK